MESGSLGSSNGYFVTAQISKSSSGNYLYWDSDPTQLAANTWYHIALVYDNNTLKIYVDGVLTNGSGTATDSGSFGSHATGNSTFPFTIGEEPYDNALDLNGYISNLRICKGHAVYKSQFIPPTRELEVHPETVLLACYDGENIFADKTGRHTIAAYGDRTSSPTPPVKIPAQLLKS